MGKTTYCDSWQKEFSWLRRADDSASAFCSVCKKTFKIDGSGISQVRAHAKGAKHLETQKILMGQSSQSIFVTSANREMQLQKGNIVLTREDLVLKAETIQALKVVGSNFSFASANDDSERFQKMFPDSEIAKSYKQGGTKVKYCIQYGIAPYLKEQLMGDLSDTPLTFKFDETTTSQVKKQHDGYAQFWSKKDNQVAIAYCGSIFIGHCTAEDLVLHFVEFGQSMAWNPRFLLHLGMDGPNVNLSFERKLISNLEENCGTKLLQLGSCSLHHMHNAFRKALAKLDLDLDQFACDIHFFFKLSSARREDYASLEEVTQCTALYALRHVTSRWLTLKPVLLRLLDQWRNLQEYFLRFLPKQKNFKKEIETTARYKRISETLKDDLAPAYMAFVAFVAHEFESFLLKFQKKEPMVHVLYDTMGHLLSQLMVKFVPDKVIMNSPGTRDQQLKPISTLISIDVLKPENQKSVKSVDIGTRAKTFLVQDDVSEPRRRKLREDCLKMYATAVTYLQKNLPFDVSVLKQACVLHPEKRHDQSSLVNVSKLTLSVAKVLHNSGPENVFPRVFGVAEETQPEDLCDLVRNQWKLYQTEVIPEQFYQEEAAGWGRKFLLTVKCTISSSCLRLVEEVPPYD